MDRKELRRRIAQHQNSVRPDELFELLEAYGWELRRISSSHYIWRRGATAISIPVHKQELKATYVRQVLALTREEDDD